MDAAVELAHGAFHLGVAFMADHDELITLFVQLGHLHMHLGHQRARGIKNSEAALNGFVLNGAAHPVRAEHQGSAWWHVVQVFNEDGTLFFQVVDHKGVVHDFVAHINRTAKFVQRALDNFNRPVHARTKTTGFGQQDILYRHHNTPIKRTSKVTG